MRTGYQFRMELKLHIREIRTSKGLTMAWLADKVGVSVPHLSEVERGKKNLNNHIIERIAEALDVWPDDLISSGEAGEDWNSLKKHLRHLDAQDRQRVSDFVQALRASAPEGSAQD